MLGAPNKGEGQGVNSSVWSSKVKEEGRRYTVRMFVRCLRRRETAVFVWYSYREDRKGKGSSQYFHSSCFFASTVSSTDLYPR